MTIRDLLHNIKIIHRLSSTVTVEQTVVDEVQKLFSPDAQIATGNQTPDGIRKLIVGVVHDVQRLNFINIDDERDWMFTRVTDDSNLELYASQPHLLFLLFTILKENWIDHDIDEFQNGKAIYSTFPTQRPLYDLFLNQHARTIRNFNRQEYFSELARLGYSHAEINGLAFPEAIESGVEGEVYPRFYTYCPSLDQFVTSLLNRGFIEENYLQANLSRLKENARLADKFGLTPGVVCFEPRSVSDALLEKYPMLRGARVDHPLRSFKPRYNLSIGHPAVRDHYAEMMENLMHEVPQLGYISIWSNDSGAGFEYTHSLYVGRNGGGYIIREWKDDKDIARSAAHNIIRFLKLLRDAGRKVNPSFRVLLRLEPFWVEHDHIRDELEEGIDVEVSSLLTKGWSLAYHHPKYPDVPEVHGTALFNRFDEKEKPLMNELKERGVNTDVISTPGIIWNHEPLIGIPFPYLVYEKLCDIKNVGVTNVCYLGGATPHSFAPFNINQELIRTYQINSSLDLDVFLKMKAEEWVGSSFSDTLVAVWKLCDEAVRSFPIPIWIYASWGVWYRLFVRPIIPNIEAIAEKDREYYEKYLISTYHNRTRVDFRYDVGFDLIEPERAFNALKQMDEDLFPTLDNALAKIETSTTLPCFIDQYDRLRALRCWYRTQRSVTAWVAGVHGYLESTDEDVRTRCKTILKEMVADEIKNTKELLHLWETSKTNWMMISEEGESTFLYGKNFGELLKRKIELMTGHENDEPYIDPDFQWRVPNLYS